MSDLDKMFKIPNLNEEQIKSEEILHEFISIMSGLANEAKKDSRSYSCDDIADILDNHVSSKLDQGIIADVLTLFADVLRDAQHSMHCSIETQLDLLIGSDIPEQQRILFRKVKNEPQVFNWIKTSSV